MPISTAEPSVSHSHPSRIPARVATAVIACLSLLAATILASLPAAAAVPVLTNPTFAQVSASGIPTGWSTWAPAGSAQVTVDPDGGPDGLPAVGITSISGADARLALTQRIDVPADSPRSLTLTGWVRGDGLSGGFSMLRLQAFNAAGAVVIPVRAGPYLAGTFDWRPYTTTIELPPAATRISVEPMLDRAAGTIWFADLHISETTGEGSLTASPSARGPVELAWGLGDVDADRYAVHRVEGLQLAHPSEATLLKVAQAATTADNTAEPAHTYTYVVQALDTAGEVLATSPAATATTADTFANRPVTSVLTALSLGSSVHVSWAVADGADATDLSLQIGTAAPVTVTGAHGTTQTAGATGELAVLRSGATELARAVVGDPSHPRSLVDEETIGRIAADLDAEAPTVTGAWQALLARVNGPASGYPGAATELYRARDAAFAYAVTGEQSYADIAYQAVMDGEGWAIPRDINMGLELGRASLTIAPAYDLAYNGWTEAQRADVRDVMTRITDLLQTYHHDTLDGADRASNWVAVTHGTELALLLAARGDADFGTHDERITYLVNQVVRHLQEGYTSSGWTQEGWDYFHYAQLYLFPSLFMAQGAGLLVLDEPLNAVDFWDLALHTVSSRADGDVVQFGVSGPNREVGGTFPLLFPTAPADSLPGLVHLYDRVQGVSSPEVRFDDVHSMWAVLYYPEHVSDDPQDMTNAQARSALLDDTAGFYAFRSGIVDEHDTLIATSNRNLQHNGWAAAETFSLSWIGQDTTWLQQGGKSQDPLHWSKPLVDGALEPYRNQYSTVRGEGVTLQSRAFDGQGGGYLSLDGSANFEVDLAHREQVVDLAAGQESGAIVAIRDRFADGLSREWNWQLRPEQSVTISTFPDSPAHEPLFVFTNPDGATLSGFVIEREGLTVEVIDGTLRLTRDGTQAEFGVVLTTSATIPTAQLEDGTLVLDGRLIDLDSLASVTSGFAAADQVDDQEQAAPAPAVLSSDNGWDTGLHDGDYTVSVDLWWGSNASRVELYEDGELIEAQTLQPATPSAQRAAFSIRGNTDGEYVYTARLVNSAGATTTAPLRVVVTDAAPGRPVLSHDNWDGDGAFVLTADLWWGTNASSYRVLQDDQVLTEGTLESSTPAHQQVRTEITGLPQGEYAFVVEWINDAGTTRSEPVTVIVHR